MTSKLDYVIKLTFDKEYNGYVADVLNLYGCMSQGKTKNRQKRNKDCARQVKGLQIQKYLILANITIL